jgi:hypothetical protein
MFKPRHKFILGIFALTQVLYWATAVCLLAFWYLPYIVMGLMAIRITSQLVITGRVMNKLSEKGFLLLVPFFEIFLMIISPLLALANIVNKPVKGR